VDSARRLQESYQGRQSLISDQSIQLEMEEPVTGSYNGFSRQPSYAIAEDGQDREFGQFETVIRETVVPSIDQRESDTSEDSFHDAEDGHMIAQTMHTRTTSLSLALARVRESFVGVSSQFECPVCFEEMRPPTNMFQCRQGHVVCQVFCYGLCRLSYTNVLLQNCRNKGRLTECPSCRGSIVGRNFAMEKLAEEYFKSFDV
jgi:hypothetical protein